MVFPIESMDIIPRPFQSDNGWGLPSIGHKARLVPVKPGTPRTSETSQESFWMILIKWSREYSCLEDCGPETWLWEMIFEETVQWPSMELTQMVKTGTSIKWEAERDRPYAKEVENSGKRNASGSSVLSWVRAASLCTVSNSWGPQGPCQLRWNLDCMFHSQSTTEPSK